MSSNIIVIGASFCGIPLAHKLLQQLPPSYSVILVDPSTHLYWNIAAPRGIVKNNTFSSNNSAMFHSTVAGFAAYSPDRFTFIQGRAVQLTPSLKTITIDLTNDQGKVTGTQTLAYAHLVVASGARVGADEALPFKHVGSHLQTKMAMETMHARIEAARTIVVSGAGTTGVETTGEIATLWPSKKVYLISAGDRPLPTLLERVGRAAQHQLESLGVLVKNNVKIVDDKRVKETTGRVVLSDGTTIDADLHIPTHGLVPNTSFVPSDMKSANGSVVITEEMRSQAWPDVWALGDAADVNYKSIQVVPKMAEVVAANILSVVKGENPKAVYKDAPPPGAFVPIGGNFAMGTGQIMSWKVWGLFVWLIKGRSYFIGKTKLAAEGKYK